MDRRSRGRLRAPGLWRRSAAGAACVGLAIAAWLLTLLVAPPAAQVVDRVVAMVGPALITHSDVRAVRALGLLAVDAATADDEVIARLVDHELVRTEVDRFGPAEPATSEIEARLAALAARIGDEAEFARVLARHAMTEARLRAFVRDELRRARYLDERFTAAAMPTEDEVTRAYQQAGDAYAVAGEIPPLEAVRDQVRARLLAARRDVLVTQWLEGLRRRADIRRPAAS